MNNLLKTSKKSDDADSAQTQKQVSVQAGGKEREPVSKKDFAELEEIGKVEISPEVEKAGVEVRQDHVEVPPDIKKLGVTQVGPSTPVVSDDAGKGPDLPLTDDQIDKGLHSKIFSSIRWLAEWCLKELKRAHMTLKKVHGKLVRVKS